MFNFIFVLIFIPSLAIAQEDCSRYLYSSMVEHNPSTSLSFKKGFGALDTEELIDGFTKASKKNFKVKELPLKDDLKWEGPKLPNQFEGIVPSFESTFTKAQLESNLVENNNPAIKIFAGMVLQIGLEQGTRHLKYSKLMQDGLAQLQTSLSKMKSSTSMQSLENLRLDLINFSTSLKMVDQPKGGMDGILDMDWVNRADFEKYKLDVSEINFSSGKEWDELGKPFKTDVLVKNLKKELEKIYSLEQKIGDDAFVWYLKKNNFGQFTKDLAPLMENLQGSEVEFLIYKQLEAGMQQSLRNLTDPLAKLDIRIGILEVRMTTEGVDLQEVSVYAEELVQKILAFKWFDRAGF